jgi:hypothetical protein
MPVRIDSSTLEGAALGATGQWRLPEWMIPWFCGGSIISSQVRLALNGEKGQKTPAWTAELQRIGPDFAQKHESSEMKPRR